MVEIKYNDRILMPSMESGQTVTLQSHGYKMPGNFQITTDPGYLKPAGTKIITIRPGETKEEDISSFKKVKVEADALDNAKYEGEYTII